MQKVRKSFFFSLLFKVVRHWASGIRHCGLGIGMLERQLPTIGATLKRSRLLPRSNSSLRLKSAAQSFPPTANRQQLTALPRATHRELRRAQQRPNWHPGPGTRQLGPRTWHPAPSTRQLAYSSINLSRLTTSPNNSNLSPR